MSAGLLVVRLKYGLYVGDLSKWFAFLFLSLDCLSCRCLFHLLPTVLSYTQAEILTTELPTKN